VVTVTDADGNSGFNSPAGSFTVDLTAIVVTANPVGFQPGNWTSDTTPTLSAGITSGSAVTSATVTVDAAACTPVNFTDTTMDCTPSTPLAEGARNVVFEAFNSVQSDTDTQTVNIDTTVPTVTNLAPTGAISTSSPTLTADLGDGSGSGIASAATAVYLDGSATPLAGCTKTASSVSCVASVTAGDHTFTVYATDNVGQTANVTSGTFTLTQISYFWSWYDNVNGDNWVLMANTDAVDSANYTLSIDGVDKTLPGGGTVAAGDIMYSQFGDMGGPVKAVSTNGVSGLLSQRTLWPKGGNSLDEVFATPESQLSNHYWWPWYDELSPGFQNWIIISNPNGTAVDYTIEIGGVVMPTTTDNPGTIPAGGTVTPRFEGERDGPVELNATGGNVIASQRVLSNNGTAFNEEPGIPNGSLVSEYFWTWYDDLSPEAMNWILIANPNGAPVTYTIEIDGQVMPTTTDNPGTIAAGEIVTPRFEDVRGGHVKVTSTGGNVIASQRSVWGPSFEEVPGEGTLTSNYQWTWYDEASAGVMNWVLIANPNGAPVTYTIEIGGVVMPTTTDNPGTIAAGEYVIPRFPGVQDGPVEVTSTGGNVITSQRVLWNGYFNEVQGHH
jgi:hypothetical protein